MSALNRISMAMAGLFGIGQAAIPLANRNYIVDGATEFGPGNMLSLSTSGAYTTANMYYGSAGNGGVATSGLTPIRTNGISQFLDSNPNCVYTHVQTTPSNGTYAGRNLPSVWQSIEYASKLSGKSITVSAKIWASSNFTLPGVRAAQSMGTGGSPSANVIFDKAVNWAITGTPTRFAVRLDVPSTANLTLGTNLNDSTTMGFWFPPNWTGTIYMTEFQVELCSPRSSSDLTGNGGSPTSFEYRGLQAEYARMNRYYQTLSDFLAGGYSGASGGNIFCDFTFPQMRASPAASLSGTPTYSNASALAINAFAANKGRLQLTVSPNNYGVGYNAAIILDARL